MFFRLNIEMPGHCGCYQLLLPEERWCLTFACATFPGRQGELVYFDFLSLPQLYWTVGLNLFGGFFSSFFFILVEWIAKLLADLKPTSNKDITSLNLSTNCSIPVEDSMTTCSPSSFSHRHPPLLGLKKSPHTPWSMQEQQLAFADVGSWFAH